MNIILKVAIFSIMMNFAVGIMGVALDTFSLEDQGGLSYVNNDTNEMINTMGGDFDPLTQLEDESDSYRLMDKVSIGATSKFILGLDTYMFGFVKMLSNLFGSYMEEDLRVMLFGTLRVIITILYIIGAIMLWTGKSSIKD